MTAGWIGVLAILSAQVAAVMPQAPETQPGDIFVTGIGKPFRLDAAGLRAAQRAFDQGRGQFAPSSRLLFEVRRADLSPASVNLRLRLTDGRLSLPLPLDVDGRFVLPTIPKGNWRITADLPRGGISIRPLVLSPSPALPDRRLGDVRLQCRIFWAMERAQASLLLKPLLGMADLAGPCTSGRIGIYFRVDRPIDTAVLREGPRTAPVSVMRGGLSYRVPVAERGYGNDAIVAFRLRAD